MKHSVYIHIPFCTHRCAYCDFNTYAGQEAAIPAYVEALGREIEFVAARAPDRIKIHTVFFGGGTPSLLSPAQLNTILGAVRRNFDVGEDAEITIEANPGTVSLEALKQMRTLGINRISFGAQSANGEELRMLERTHTFLDVMKAVSAARRAGFDNLNLDVIYGLPGQQMETWKTTVRRVLELRPEHVSAYALALEHGTPFGKWATRGMLPIPDPDTAAEMYEWAGECLESDGYQQYEISNWGRTGGGVKPDAGGQESGKWEQPASACLHNLQYWRCLPYLGFGAGAHGYAGGFRYSNVLRIATFIERVSAAADGENRLGVRDRRLREDRREGGGLPGFPMSPATVNQHRQTPGDDMSEFMITGLRLTHEGVRPAEFRERFGRDLMDMYGGEIQELLHLGLLESVDHEPSEAARATGLLRLTKRGRLLGNQVFMRFV